MVVLVQDTTKFKLLLWKNSRLIWRQKMQLAGQILIPSIFMFVVFIVRVLFDPHEIKEPIIYPSINLTLDIFRSMEPTAKISVKEWKLAYSPQNPLFEKIVSEASTELGLEGFVPLTNAKLLQEHLTQYGTFAGIEFEDRLIFATELPTELIYAIRLPSEQRLHTEQFLLATWETGSLFDVAHFGGPRSPQRDTGGYPDYISEGFAAIQNAISMNFIKLLPNYRPFPPLYLTRMPVTAHVYDTITHVYINVLGLLILLSFMYTAGLNARYIANEKELQLREIMKIMGVRNTLHWLAWFIISYNLMLLSVIFLLIMLKIPVNKGFSVLPNTDFTVLLFFFAVYCLVSIAFFFMIGTFFAKASTANFASSFLWFLGYFPFQFVEANYAHISDSVKYTICLIPNSALCFAFKLILRLEATGEGFRWSNLTSPTNADDNLRISRIMIIMVVSTFIEFVLTLYFEKVHPGPFGVPAKWYFPFKKRFWIRKRRNIDDEDRREAFMELYGEIEERDENKFEPDPPHKRIGVLIRRLWKIYGKRVAVKNLSVNLYKNEITILLGHNGAGKTSTISMLTGMIPPTKGTAILNGYDIRINLQEARQSLGLCPQYNILFDELTVREHIIFYSRLKGLDSSSVHAEVDKYVKILNLERKIDKRSETLSGGMKRKLSVASALCGDSKVVLLDEPSSGMDPAARRALWDIIQNEKKNRTILLSTHFMEEAEALGDRIAIMQAGVLECYGTSYFLKKKFGCGYHLICIKRPNCETNKITQLLAKYIPEIEVESDIGTELSYRLPDAYSKNFETILSQIETKSNELNLDGYGISLTTLEDVFMTVGAEHAVTNNVDEDTPKITDGGTFYHDEHGEPIKLLKGIYLRLSQWRAILLKKALYVRRGYKMYLISWSLAILIILLTIYQTMLYQSLKPMGSLKFSIADYHASITLLVPQANSQDNTAEELQKQYLEIVNSFGKAHEFDVRYGNQSTDMDKYLVEYGKENLIKYKEKYLIGAAIFTNILVAYFSNEPLHCVPLSLNTLHNAMARSIHPQTSIQVINKPLPYQKETQLADAQAGFNFGFMLACNVCLALSFLSGLYIILPVREKENRAKLLQFVCGCKGTIFWFGCFIIDLITLCITMLIMVLVLSTFNQTGFRSFKELGRLFLIFVMYGLTILPLYYLISCGLRRSAPAYAKISIMNLITGIIPFFLIYILTALGTIHNLQLINLFLMVLPHYNLAIAMVNLYTIGTTTKICKDICENYETIYNHSFNCSTSYLCANNVKHCCLKDFFDSDSPGCLYNLIYYAIETIIFFCILVLVEERVFDKLYYKLYPPNRVPESIFHGNKNFQDDDVVEEERKIKNMGASEIRKENLIIFGLSKYYKKFIAVNNLYLQVKNAECFGLLGVNGAGKTSTFKVLTGDTKINYGAVFVRGISLTEHMRAVYRRIGYCPQFDALLEDLTGREVMKVFCLIRGIPEDKIQKTIYKLAQAFGFNIHLDKKVKNYSGGNKRKLSTSIALLGNPAIIYLDEPTTGMDPGARRQLWDVICKVRDSGKAIVLTSHSMEECEALCTRLAIMVNGEFKCIGSIQHLKNKFSKGLVLKIKLKYEDTEFFKSNFSLMSIVQSNEFVVRLTNVQSFIEREFPNSILKEKFQTVLTFHVIMEQIQWSKIFGIMEKNKEELNIEDYSINQTTLESIFLEFAKSQMVDNRNYK